MDRILPNFVYTLLLTRSGLVLYFFFIFATELQPLIISKLVFAQYLENGWTEFNQILNTHFL